MIENVYKSNIYVNTYIFENILQLRNVPFKVPIIPELCISLKMTFRVCAKHT